MSKIVHLFDNAGVYVCDYTPQECPLTPGSFITPTDSTEVPVPVTGVNENAVFSKITNTWSIVPVPLV